MWPPTLGDVRAWSPQRHLWVGDGSEAAAPGSKGGYKQAATEVLAEAGSEGIPGWGRTLECGLEARGWARQSGLSL